jgi:putative ATP-dependent endonuclease of OLD family
MRISEVQLKGFRNFKEATIKFCKKTLIIGSNDIGKTNLLYALRILLDKTLSENDLEPKDSDFYVYEETNDLSIIIKFEDVTEDCIIAKMRESISDDGEMYLGYFASREPQSKLKTYKLVAGHNTESLNEIQGRFYLKVLSLKYISSNRDLFSYLRRERRNLLQDSKAKRDETTIQEDNTKISAIETNLKKINTKITQLSFIKQATDVINTELSDLSFHNSGQQVVFDVGATDTEEFIDNLELVSKVNGKSLIIGGDGRNNQIFLALWAARNGIQNENLLEVTICAIEEPEAHLHPHQQRKLADYLANVIKGQVIITTHSPQISCEFSPNSIIRLCSINNEIVAANDGCGPRIEEAFINFGHRLNILPAEAFFSNVVLLIEGTSELLFYKALAPEIGVDLDRLNISILNVDGVGFEPFIELLQSLEIDFVLRTDNDIFKIPRKNKYRYAGIQRCLNIYKNYCDRTPKLDELINKENYLTGFSIPIPDENSLIAEEFTSLLEEYDLFMSDKDLEQDLKNSELGKTIKKYFKEIDDDEIVPEMQKQKATFMYSFLRENSNSLGVLKKDPIAKPLLRCKEIAEGL